MVDAFFLAPKGYPAKCLIRSSRPSRREPRGGIQAKCLIRSSRQEENWRKRLYFQCTVKMKQPQTITEPKNKDNHL